MQEGTRARCKFNTGKKMDQKRRLRDNNIVDKIEDNKQMRKMPKARISTKSRTDERAKPGSDRRRSLLLRQMSRSL